MRATAGLDRAGRESGRPGGGRRVGTGSWAWRSSFGWWWAWGRPLDGIRVVGGGNHLGLAGRLCRIPFLWFLTGRAPAAGRVCHWLLEYPLQREVRAPPPPPSARDGRAGRRYLRRGPPALDAEDSFSSASGRTCSWWPVPLVLVLTFRDCLITCTGAAAAASWGEDAVTIAAPAGALGDPVPGPLVDRSGLGHAEAAGGSAARRPPEGRGAPRRGRPARYAPGTHAGRRGAGGRDEERGPARPSGKMLIWPTGMNVVKRGGPGRDAAVPLRAPPSHARQQAAPRRRVRTTCPR